MPNRLAMVRAVAASLASVDTVDGVAEAVLESAGQYLDAITSSVWLVSRDGAWLEMAYETNAHPDAVARFGRVSLTSDLPGPQVVRTGEAHFLGSRGERDGLWPVLADVPSPSEAMVVLPLEAKGTRIGVVSFGFATAREFDGSDRDALLAVADQSAIALDRARLYERERARTRTQEMLATLSGAVGQSLDWMQMAEFAVSTCIDGFVDTCALYIREGELVRRVAVASRAHPDLAEDLVDRFPTPITANAPNAAAIRTGEPCEVGAITPDLLAEVSPSPGFAERVAGVQAGAGWAFPLQQHDRVFGSMVFLAPPDGWLDDEMKAVAASAARRTGDLLASVATFAEQRAALDALHEVVLPAESSEITGFEVSACYLPVGADAPVGGDWWDALELPSGEVAVAIGDVAGHGIPAVALMGQLRNALRMQLVSGKRPNEALDDLGTYLDWIQPDAHCTAIVVAATPGSSAIGWANAGHLPPLLVGPDGTARYLETTPGPPLGVVPRPGARYAEHAAQLEPGATLLLFTDGLIEGRRRSIDDGLAALAALGGLFVTTEPVRTACNRVLAALVDRPEDDVCVVAIRRERTPGPD